MEYGLELYHHGVKGQHWGKRNGPPYPLYRKSAYYKKTGQRPPGYTGNKKGKSDSGGTNKSGRVGGLKDIKRAGDTSWVRKRTLRNLTGGRIGGIDDSKSEKRKQLAKKIAIGAGTAAALAGAGYLAYRNRDKLGSMAKNARKGISNTYNSAKAGISKKSNAAYNTYLREAGKVRRNASNAKDYIKRTYNNKIRTAPGKAKELLSKPGSKVYERIAGESKRAAQAANYDMALNAKRKASLEKFIKSNAQAVENATISKRKVLANIRRGDYVKTGDTLRNLNAKANNIAAKERELISRGNEAKKLLASVGSQTKEGAARYNAAMTTFNKRNKLGRIAAGATNAGIGLGLAGAAGGAGYGISKLARSGKKKNQNRGTIGGLTKRMTASSTDSAVTRRAKAAYNSMSDAEFRRKYSVSKAEYARRVEKYGDPYKNSPMAKLGRRLSRRRRRW